jgi:hypothetical protein
LRFKINKNGVHFHFKKDIGELGGENYKEPNQGENFKEIFIEKIVFEV